MWGWNLCFRLQKIKASVAVSVPVDLHGSSIRLQALETNCIPGGFYHLIEESTMLIRATPIKSPWKNKSQKVDRF